MKTIMIAVMSLFLMASCSHSAKHSEKAGCTDCKDSKASGGCDDCKDDNKTVSPKKS